MERESSDSHNFVRDRGTQVLCFFFTYLLKVRFWYTALFKGSFLIHRLELMFMLKNLAVDSFGIKYFPYYPLLQRTQCFLLRNDNYVEAAGIAADPSLIEDLIRS